MSNGVSRGGCPLSIPARGVFAAQTSGVKRFMHNSASNFRSASQATPIVSECSDLNQGIASGDFKKVGLNAGVLALGAISGGSFKTT